MPSAGSGTIYDIQVTGTVAAHSLIHVKVLLHVTNTSIVNPRDEKFYREIEYYNASYTSTAFHGTYALAIVPELNTTDTVQASLSWSYEL